MSLNKVILEGYIGKDPTMNRTQLGSSIANISLATTEKWKDKSGEYKTKTDWHKLVAFGKTAEIIEKYLVKGSQIVVVGRLTYNEYTGKDDVKRRDAVVNIDELHFIGSKSQSSETNYPTPPAGVETKPPQNKKAGRPSMEQMGDIEDEKLPF